MKFVGIDPGWASTGIAIYTPEVKSWEFKNTEPRKEGVSQFVTSTLVPIDGITEVVIERFVAYEGVHSDASEKILMLIGAALFSFESKGVGVNLVRAIDWKPTLCKWLIKNRGFTNPSTSFDKKYSIAAANCILEADGGITIKTDHEADAICLAFLGSLKHKVETSKKK